EAEAWMGDTSVQAVDLRAADAVQIGARAFGGCTALRKVLLCAGATYEADSFSGCENVVLFLPEENTTDDVEESALPWVTLVGGT
ncbi:MAG: hypothetical protein IKO13_04350, partial [Oscillospiraceae bacterium]|nr:hypothetical protein [Oscillospiraceae bacterium]